MGLFNQFPYSDMHELNADWLLKEVQAATAKIDGVVAEVRQMIEDAEADFNRQFEAFRLEIQSTINALNQKLIDFQNSIDKQFADYQKKLEGIIQETLDEIDALLNKFQGDVNKQLQEMRALIKASEAANRAYVDAQIQKVIDMIPEITSVYVRNPVTGEIQPIQDTLDSLNNYYRYFGLTAIEYEERNWTAAEYDALELTAFEFDFYAKEKYAWISPFTGEWISTYQWLVALTAFHLGDTLTAEGYDNLGLTAQIYDGKEVTAYQYDFHGRTALAA